MPSVLSEVLARRTEKLGHLFAFDEMEAIAQDYNPLLYCLMLSSLVLPSLFLLVLPMATSDPWALLWLKQIYGLLFCFCEESHWCV